MRNLSIILVIFFFFIDQGIFAQSENVNWYFGQKAGITFKNGSPVVLNNSQIPFGEGCASISDKSGNLLFYTHGFIVHNKDHEIMLNGSGLLGHSSSTQVQIAPQPGNDSIYYIFTVDAAENHLVNGLKYSIVNMKLDNGKGAITLKNITLLKPCTEKITIGWHSNLEDLWIVTHSWRDNKFYSYKLSSAGLNTTPVISSIGSIHDGGSAGSPISNGYTNAVGYLRFSPGGDLLAVAIHDAGILELLRFDQSTGIVTTLLSSVAGYRYIYGLEFSENEKFLYTSTSYGESSLYQFDIQNETLQSVIQIANPGNNQIDALSMGPDRKIYIASYNGSHSLGMIQYPNNQGISCNYIPDAINLGTGLSVVGLPQGIVKKTSVDFELADDCYNDHQDFNIISNTILDSVRWEFGDPASGLNNTSTDSLGVHHYPSPGTYEVELKYYSSVSQDSIKRNINLVSVVELNLGNDTILCGGEQIMLDVSDHYGSFKWSDGSTLPVKTVNLTGEYSVVLTSSCGIASDTINVDYSIIPEPLSITDSTVCLGEEIEIRAIEQPGLSYNWSTGAHTSSISIIPSEDINVSLIVTNEFSCVANDNISLNIINCYEKIEIPNVFTPNQDNINDFWIIKNIEHYPNAEIFIYTRWGRLIYESKGYQSPWDGIYNGKILPMGCYYYVIILNNGTPAYTGHVSIYR